VLLQAQKRSRDCSQHQRLLCFSARLPLSTFFTPPPPTSSQPSLPVLLPDSSSHSVLRHGDYHQAMGFVISFLMLFLDDNDILKIVCVACTPQLSNRKSHLIPFFPTTTSSRLCVLHTHTRPLQLTPACPQIHSQRRAQVHPSAHQPKITFNPIFCYTDTTPAIGKHPLPPSSEMQKCMSPPNFISLVRMMPTAYPGIGSC
jgi:hypothetical protein